MNSRRKFIVQGGLATTALLAAKPFSAIAKVASPFTSTATSRSFVLLHTAHMNSCHDAEIINYISEHKTTHGAILATAGNKIGTSYHTLQYDATPHNGEELFNFNDDYKIIRKGAVRTGIIIADPSENNVIEKVIKISKQLKKDKGCQVVVCLSQLGYKNSNGIDDITLAASSTHLDIIIGGHPSNFHAFPMIAQNLNREEVIIHSTSGDKTGCGKIEIHFDELGKKKFLNLSNKVA
jgi:hypothetical protein